MFMFQIPDPETLVHKCPVCHRDWTYNFAIDIMHKIFIKYFVYCNIIHYFCVIFKFGLYMYNFHLNNFVSTLNKTSLNQTKIKYENSRSKTIMSWSFHICNALMQ